jgi:hypothetical protein
MKHCPRHSKLKGLSPFPVAGTGKEIIAKWDNIHLIISRSRVQVQPPHLAMGRRRWQSGIAFASSS